MKSLRFVIEFVMWFICMKAILLWALSTGKHHTGRGGKGIYVLSSTFRPLSGKIMECIHSHFRVMFSIYGINLTIFWSFEYISHQDRLLKIFSSSVIMWPAGLYMNGEITQAQSIEFVNVEILQHVFVVCSVRDCRNILIF